LNPGQKEQLRSALWGNDVLFDGRLKKYVGKKIRLDLHKNSHPIHCKPSPVPQTQVDVFKKECERLIKEDVLEPVGATEHAYCNFIIPKKDGTVRWVSDFWKLNQMLRRRVYPLPRIQDVLHRRPGYKFLRRLISLCATIPLNWTRRVKKCVWLLRLLESFAKNGCQWEFCKHQVRVIPK
jgi:hypothetical protein